MRVNNDYKGTAFGDPARSLTAEQRIKDSKLQIANADRSKAETTQVKSAEKFNRQASAADQAKTAANLKAPEARAQQTQSYPVDYKGTTFGDPAVTGRMIGGNLDIYM